MQQYEEEFSVQNCYIVHISTFVQLHNAVIVTIDNRVQDTKAEVEISFCQM